MKLRGLVLFLLLWGLVSPLHAEKWNLGWDLGGGGGLTGYTGDLNLSPTPREVGVNLGLLARFTFNKYYAARFNLFGGNVSGHYTSERYALAITRGKKIEDFNHFFIGFDANVEINFLPFIVNILAQKRINDDFIAPYATFGLGALAASGGGMHVYTPMGAGVKVALGSRLTIAGDLRFLKMYRDELDGYKNIPTNDGIWSIHNQDWISMFSVTCSYRLFFRIQRCAAYN